MVNESDITAYIENLIHSICKHANIQRDFLLEHMVKHFRNQVPHLNVFVSLRSFKLNKELVESTHRVIEVPYPDSPHGKLECDLELFKSGKVTFIDPENKESVFYDGKFTKHGNTIEFANLEPIDP